MRRVFPRGNLKLLCQRCMNAGKETPAGVQGATQALCWECLKNQEMEKAEYKEDVGRRFDECMTAKTATDDDEEEIEEDENAAVD